MVIISSVKVVFTKHAKKKFKNLAKLGFVISRKDVLSTIHTPEHVDHESDRPKIIVSRQINQKYIIRVVFKNEGDIIIVITFYPTRKGRYYEKTSKN